MTPFQEFRLWARRAPGGERVSTGIAAVLVLAVLAWVLVPSGATKPDSLTAFPQSGATGGIGAGTAGGATASTPMGAVGAGTTGGATGTTTTATAPAGTGTTGNSSGANTGATSGTVNGTTGSAGATSGSTGDSTTKTCPSSSAPGVTAGRIKVAIMLVNIVGPAGNQAFDIPTPAEQQSIYEALLADVNAKGGVACRTLVAQFFKGNPADQSDLHQKCQDVAQAGVFAVLDGGAYAQFPSIDCYAQHKIPYFGIYLMTKSVQRKNYPYLFDFNTLDALYQDTVFGLKARGFFSAGNGFKKLGFVYHNCDQAQITGFNSWLAKAGIPSDKIVTYNVGCPTAFGSPSDLQQAVLKFQRAGVTHVTTASFVGDFANFTKIAQQQGFKPKYGLGDDSIVPLTYGSQAPDYNNIAGAIVISASRDGEDRTPGMTPTAGTKRCDTALTKKGLATAYSQSYAGNACDNVLMFAAAADHVSALKGEALAAGLERAGSVDFSYPQGPNDFSRAEITYGGQFWRPLEFMPACECWRVIDRTFHPTFS